MPMPNTEGEIEQQSPEYATRDQPRGVLRNAAQACAPWFIAIQTLTTRSGRWSPVKSMQIT
jgi:hypothetical protein